MTNKAYLIVCMTTILSLIIAQPTTSLNANAWENVTYSGRAIGVHAMDVDTQFSATFSDTGELPPEGGKLTAGEASASDDLFSTGILESVTTGFDETSESTASAADVILLGDTENQITADFVRAISQVNCMEDPASTEIHNLMVGGQSVVVTGEANQVVNVADDWLTLIINEQEISLVTDEQGNTSNFVKVNGLHLISTTGEEVIIASVESDINCGAIGGGEEIPPPEECTFVTGGGYINGASDGGNGKANFGFNARPDLRGHLNYMDHTTSPKLHVKMFDLDSFECIPKCPDNPNPPDPASEGARMFSGPVEVNGDFGYATVCVEDNGEPGNQPKGSDWFSITLSDGYYDSGLLEGGNIQVHKHA